jgi:hypothetical protein
MSLLAVLAWRRSERGAETTIQRRIRAEGARHCDIFDRKIRDSQKATGFLELALAQLMTQRLPKKLMDDAAENGRVHLQ